MSIVELGSTWSFCCAVLLVLNVDNLNVAFIYSYGFFLGATESIGKHMLEACNNNLEMAVTMFLDGGGIAEEPSTSSGSAAASSSRAPPEE